MRLAAALLIVAALGCGKDTSSAPGSAAPGTAGATVDDTAVARQLIASGAAVVDVREQAEWDEGHLPQAKLYPVGTIDAHVDEIAALAGGRDRPVVVYCGSGGRAGKAKQVLEAAGFTRVTNGGGYRKLATP